MDIDLDKIFAEQRVEQCRIGSEWLFRLVDREVKPKVYLEIGCAKLGTLYIHQHLLPDDGLAIGIDVRTSEEWEDYQSPNKSETCLIRGDSASSEVIQKVKETLNSRQIDFLFIDGDHNIEPVQKDWDNYSPLVRTGGMIAFHDFDWGAYMRGVTDGQGAAWVCARLKSEKYMIQTVPVGSIGVAFVRK